MLLWREREIFWMHQIFWSQKPIDLNIPNNLYFFRTWKQWQHYNWCLLYLFSNSHSHTADSNTSTSGSPSGVDAFASADQLKSFIDIIVPLLIQCWIEAGPSQLVVKLPGNTHLTQTIAKPIWLAKNHHCNPSRALKIVTPVGNSFQRLFDLLGNALGADALAMLAGVLGVLKLLLQCVHHHSNAYGGQLVSSLSSWQRRCWNFNFNFAHWKIEYVRSVIWDKFTLKVCVFYFV